MKVPIKSLTQNSSIERLAIFELPKSFNNCIALRSKIIFDSKAGSLLSSHHNLVKELDDRRFDRLNPVFLPSIGVRAKVLLVKKSPSV